MTFRILIIESNPKYRHMLRRYVVKGCKGASVQASSTPLHEYLTDEHLTPFDVVLAGCDFGEDGTHRHPGLTALRGVTANPDNPPIILLAASGSEFSAVQAIKSGAFDYIPRQTMDREQIIGAVNRAVQRTGSNGSTAGNDNLPNIFGYDLRRCLAQSEEGSVHIAYSGEHTREVVLKILRRGSGPLARDQLLDRFVGEFKLLSDIDDPVVARIYDFRVKPQLAYIAMEYFPLGHLGRRMNAGITPEDALHFIEEIAHALSIIHGAGVLHLDLKPANIMVREDGSVALIDFGISRSADGAITGNKVNEPGGVIGTPYYMSPEQARGENTDERSDLYALGIMLYEMLVGEKPFRGDTPTEILDAHKSEPIPDLPTELQSYQSLVTNLLAKDPEQRLGNARELVEVVETLKEQVAAA